MTELTHVVKPEDLTSEGKLRDDFVPIMQRSRVISFVITKKGRFFNFWDKNLFLRGKKMR